MRHDWRMQIIRGADCTIGQRAAIAELLLAENGRVYPGWTVEQAAAETGLAGPIPVTFVAVDDGCAIGCASLLDDDEVTGWDDHAWLGNVAVVEAARGHGVGSALVSAVETHATSIGVTALHLVTTSAVDWYRAKGWDVVGVGDVHGHSMTVMRKTLS